MDMQEESISNRLYCQPNLQSEGNNCEKQDFTGIETVSSNMWYGAIVTSETLIW